MLLRIARRLSQYRTSYNLILTRDKHNIDFSKFPELVESDLEEQHVRGSGPGGQATNKTSNCVVLKHKPTGIIVKCHQERSLWFNRQKARSLLLTKLDNIINKEHSVEAQTKAIEKKKQLANAQKKKKLNSLKEQWKEREKT